VDVARTIELSLRPPNEVSLVIDDAIGDTHGGVECCRVWFLCMTAAQWRQG
jgi:hypothetical protein